MSRRKYSVAEIDRMRSDVTMLIWPKPHDDRTIEERLRTYMLNGTDPEELRIAAEEKREQQGQHAASLIEKYSRKPGDISWVEQ